VGGGILATLGPPSSATGARDAAGATVAPLDRDMLRPKEPPPLKMVLASRSKPALSQVREIPLGVA
jgi:hypothetical protein